MNGTACKRMLVKAMGFKYNLMENTIEMYTTENRNYTGRGCTGEPGKCGCTHAEINLLRKFPYPDIVFVTHSPCLNCAKELVNHRVRKVVYIKEYRIKDGIDYLKKNNVHVEQIEP